MLDRPEDYDALINSVVWAAAIADLNATLCASLADRGLPQILNGNLFYAHRQRNIAKTGYMADFDDKRRNFFTLAQASSNLLEIGVNGGHSLLLALMANPQLQVTGIDVCERLGPDWAHVEVYVPAAFAWLTRHFPGRAEFVTGNSLIEIPRYVLQHPDAKFDMLHLDGSKHTHLQEYVSAQAILSVGAFIVHDDINLGPVRRSDRQLRKLRFTEEVDLEPLGLVSTVWQGIRRKV